MLTRIFAALIAALALAAPRAALADDAVAGAIVGAITGAAIATGAVVPYERREPLREYIVRESRPTYHLRRGGGRRPRATSWRVRVL